VIIEGIEDRDMLNLIRRISSLAEAPQIGGMQGYLLGRPQPVEEARDLGVSAFERRAAG
jgi:hypothetical protein